MAHRWHTIGRLKERRMDEVDTWWERGKRGGPEERLSFDFWKVSHHIQQLSFDRQLTLLRGNASDTCVWREGGRDGEREQQCKGRMKRGASMWGGSELLPRQTFSFREKLIDKTLTHTHTNQVFSRGSRSVWPAPVTAPSLFSNRRVRLSVGLSTLTTPTPTWFTTVGVEEVRLGVSRVFG